MWKVSGRHIVAAGSLRRVPVAASDDLGEEILSHVPRQLRQTFLSTAGQLAVSYQVRFLYYPSKLNEPQIGYCMGNIRSTKLGAVRTAASLIFGAPFKPEWFVTDYNRATEPTLVKLSGAELINGVLTYCPFAPILFPDGNMEDDEDIFMNPVLVRVGYFLSTARS